MPYRRAAQLLTELLPLPNGSVSQTTVRRHTLLVGERFNQRALEPEEYDWPECQREPDIPAHRVTVAIDGTYIRAGLACWNRQLHVVAGRIDKDGQLGSHFAWVASESVASTHMKAVLEDQGCNANSMEGSFRATFSGREIAADMPVPEGVLILFGRLELHALHLAGMEAKAMNNVFEPRAYFTVPDGTDVSPFLNATDSTQSGVPWGALGDLSIAAGRINSGVASWIHYHPVLVLVTYVVSGRLAVRMKGPSDQEPYKLNLRKEQAAITEAGTWFRLENSGVTAVEVLYIASPAYVFEVQGDKVIHDDAVLVARSWDRAAAQHRGEAPDSNAIYQAGAAREEAKRRLAKLKGVAGPSLSVDSIHRLSGLYDYLAPDRSEIRLLVDGERGGFSHCLLPAGQVSSAVRHRTVEELWYVLEGQGEIWRSRDEQEGIDPITAGDSFFIRPGTAFQFRANAGSDLKLLIATIPRWPGPQEAVEVSRRQS
jgi:mannose-6-phosphate isomerase-like protein (cupin superfamily)